MDWINQNSDIIGLVLDLFSLIVSIVITCFIFFFETKRNVEIEQMEAKQREAEVNHKAQSFLSEFEDDQDYLILSYCAKKLQLKRKHHRNITTRFLILEPEVQQTVLKMVNIDSVEFDNEIFDKALQCFRNDFNVLDIGQDFLYDGGKYFHRSFDDYAACSIENVNPYIFTSILSKIRMANKDKSIFFNRDSKDTFYGYVCEYFRVEESGYTKKDFLKPIDELNSIVNLHICDEHEMTFWMMRLVIDICHWLDDSSWIKFNEDLIQTYEDMYYYAAMTLCMYYLHKEDCNNDCKRNRT